MPEKPTVNMPEYIASMNPVLQALNERGTPFRVPFQGQPQLQVDSVVPLVYREYGRVFNRAPHVSGLFPVVRFIAQTIEVNGQDSGWMRAFGVIEASPDLHYGVLADFDAVHAAARHITRIGREFGIVPEPQEGHQG